MKPHALLAALVLQSLLMVVVAADHQQHDSLADLYATQDALSVQATRLACDIAATERAFRVTVMALVRNARGEHARATGDVASWGRARGHRTHHCAESCVTP